MRLGAGPGGGAAPRTLQCYCNVNFQGTLRRWLWLPSPAWATHSQPGKGVGRRHRDARDQMQSKVLLAAILCHRLPWRPLGPVCPWPYAFSLTSNADPASSTFKSRFSLFGLATVCVS